MRQRRHGDPTVTHPPGVDLDAWRKKVATLERELARAQAMAPPSAPCAACAGKDREIERLAALLDGQRGKAELAAKRAAARAAKPAQKPDEKTRESYEREIRSLRAQLLKKSEQFEELVNRTTILLGSHGELTGFASAADRKFALSHFHPDRFKSEGDRATRVFQLLNNIPVIDR
jgi:hypothetical protein